MLTLTAGSVTPMAAKCTVRRRFTVRSDGFPSFLPKEVQQIKDPSARKLATLIERLPVRLLHQVSLTGNSIMSSSVKPLIESKTSPVVLLHGFDSSCLEWRYTYPLIEEDGLETWAVDILGWGFSNLERLPSCDVASKRHHFYQSYIKKPMILVGPSLGAAVAIDFAVNYPDAVEKLVLIDASVYAEGMGNLVNFAENRGFCRRVFIKERPFESPFVVYIFDATVDLMRSGGYKVGAQIEKAKQKRLIIWCEDDQIISNKLAARLHCELSNAIICQIPDCGHLPRVERPRSVAKLIVEFAQQDCRKEAQCISQL